MACKKFGEPGTWPLSKKNEVYRRERQVHPELKNYYSIEKYMVLPDDADSSFLICVDAQTLELLHSLIEPKYAARWYREDTRATDNRRRITSEKDMAWVDKLWARLQDQLADMACISELSEAIKTQNTLIKYQIALMANDGRIMHDSAYEDPQTVFDETTNPTPDAIPIRDKFEPAFSTNNWVYGDKGIADAVVEQLYEGLMTGGLDLPDPFGGLGLADIHQQIRLIQQKQEVALKHINAKLSRDNAVPVNLTEDGAIFSGNQSPSALTYDRFMPGGSNEWLGSILVESLRAGVRPGVSTPLGGIGGAYGMGLADLLKMPEPPKTYYGGLLTSEGGVYYFDSATTGRIQVWPLFGSPLQGESITRRISGAFFRTSDDKSWFESIWEAIDYLKCICSEIAGIPPALTSIKDAIPVPAPSSGVDLTKVEQNLLTIANAIDSLEIAGRNDTTTIEAAIDRLASATEDISITTIANSGEMAQISIGGCCPDLPETTIPVDPVVDDSLYDDPYIPVITKPSPILEDESDDCYPTGTNNWITFLDNFIWAIDIFEDTFGPDITAWAAPKVLLLVAYTGTGVAGSMAALNLITLPDPSDVFTSGGTALGVFVSYILTQILADLGIEGVKILVNYIRTDYDFWKAIECNETSFDIDILPQTIGGKIDDFAKGLGKSDEVADKMRIYLKKLLDTDLRYELFSKKKLKI